MKKLIAVVCVLAISITAVTFYNVRQQNMKEARQIKYLMQIIDKKQDRIEELEKQLAKARATAHIHEQFSYMDYSMITATDTPNYEYSVCKATTDSNGLRKIGKDYCVAMSKAFATRIGSRFKVTMSTGNSFTVIMTDQKAPCDCYGSAGRDGSILEFLVDESTLNAKARQMGSVSYITGFNGQIKRIKAI